MLARLARRASSARRLPGRARPAAALGLDSGSGADADRWPRCTSATATHHHLGGGTSSIRRPLHATSLARSDGPREEEAGSGFGAFLDRRGQENEGRSAPSSNYHPAAGALSTDDMDHPEEGWPGERDDPDRDAENEHYFGHYFDEDREESELQEWHRTKEEEYGRLASSTERMLGSSIANQGDVEEVVGTMQKWNAFSASVSSELRELSDFRRKNKQYPPSEFMTSTTCHSAEMAERLLAHLLGGGMALDPATEVKAYQLAMQAWSRAFSSASGDRCEDIIERYGERFGGDFDHMPSIEAYKTVLRAHLQSCLSYAPARDGEGEGGSPGGKALSLAALLANVHTAGDLVLKPDSEVYSLAIAAVRNTLLDSQGRRRFRRDETKWSLERNLAEGLVGAFERMEACLDEERGEGGESGKELSLAQWHGAIGAYADVLATVARILLDDEEMTTEKMLSKLERFVDANSQQIADSIDKSGLSEDDARDVVDDIQSRMEESYTSALLSGLILSKERGPAFDGLDRALDNAAASDAIFQRLASRSQKPPMKVEFLFPRPTPYHYQGLIQCWSECVRRSYSTPESNATMGGLDVLPHLMAESLLKELEAKHSSELDGSAHVAVMWAWSQVLSWPAIYRQRDYHFAVNAIDDLLQRTMEGYRRGSIRFTSHESVAKMYNFAFRLNSKVFRGGEGAVKRSLKLLDQMEYWYRESGGAIARPDAFTFALILKTIARSGSESSASQAEAIFQRMQQFGVKPREKHYLAAIRAHSQKGGKKGDSDSDPKQAEAILQLVKEKYATDKSVKPTAALYTACISAYGGSKKFNSASRVVELFEEVETLYKETEDEAFRPDGMLYGVVIDAVSKAKSNDDSSLRQALRLLDQMERSFDAGEIETAPNRYAYTNLLRSIARSRATDRVTLAEVLIQRMQDRSSRLQDDAIRPDAHAYTTVIQVLSHSGLDFAVERAQKWLNRMEALYDEGDASAKPNKVTYTALINCWRSSNRPEAGQEAENIIHLMERKCSEEGDLDVKPDAYVYAAAIDAWARSKAPDKAGRAWDIYQRMKQQYLKGNLESRPNNVIMTSIIKACGYTWGGREDKQRALKVLLECMADLQSEKYLGPSCLTYRSLLNAAKALVADDAKRRPIAANIFEACCRAGQLDRAVLEALENVQPELYDKLPVAADIPSRWKRNVAKPKQSARDFR